MCSQPNDNQWSRRKYKITADKVADDKGWWMIMISQSDLFTVSGTQLSKMYLTAKCKANGQRLRLWDSGLSPEKDAGSHISFHGMRSQYNAVADWVKSVLDTQMRILTTNREEVFISYPARVRKILEHWVQIWCQHFKKDIEELESIQKSLWEWFLRSGKPAFTVRE